MANEIDTDEVHGDADNPITETTGTAWITPVHDAAGNMTTVPRPGGPASGLTLKWDAWNRLVEVKSGAITLAKHRYDGLRRRIDRMALPFIGFQHDHTYYDASWRVLEIRQVVGETEHPETLQPKYQYVWSARYIDSPVLRGQLRSCQWLIYAHAPRGRRRNVKITVADYRAVSPDVSVAGSFYLVDEKLGSVRPVE